MTRSAARRLGALAFAAAVLHLVLSAYACGDTLAGSKTEGEPCTRSDECELGLVCAGGVCRAVDAGPQDDAGGDDAGAEARE